MLAMPTWISWPILSATDMRFSGASIRAFAVGQIFGCVTAGTGAVGGAIGVTADYGRSAIVNVETRPTTYSPPGR